MNGKSPLVTLTLLVCSAACLTGCGRSPRATHYILEPVAKAEVTGASETGKRIFIGAINVPEIIDRPQLVVRVDGSKVDILETHRWAEPLKSALPRLLAENISRTLGVARFSNYPDNPSGEVDYMISVDIRRLESTADSVTVDAIWTIRRKPQGTEKNGRSTIVEQRGREGGYVSMTAAYNRALALVSREITAAIRAE